MDDVWFELCLGDVVYDDDGAYKYTPKHTRLSRLSASNIERLASYRRALHELLDKAIDQIDLSRQNERRHNEVV